MEIHEPCRFKKVCLIIGNASRIIFKQNTISSLETFVDNQSDLQIQEGTSINSAVIRMAEGHGNFLSIGKDCMLSDEILFRPSDGHVILDKTTGKLLNKPQGITIGDHVWIGQRAVFLKGASVADNSIVGASSVVTRHFEEKNIIIAGNPAKKIRKISNGNAISNNQPFKYKKSSVSGAFSLTGVFCGKFLRLNKSGGQSLIFYGFFVCHNFFHCRLFVFYGRLCHFFDTRFDRIRPRRNTVQSL